MNTTRSAHYMSQAIDALASIMSDDPDDIRYRTLVRLAGTPHVKRAMKSFMFSVHGVRVPEKEINVFMEMLWGGDMNMSPEFVRAVQNRRHIYYEYLHPEPLPRRVTT